MSCPIMPNIKPCSIPKTNWNLLVKQKHITKQEADICKAAEQNGFNVSVHESMEVNYFDKYVRKVEIEIKKIKSS